MSTSIDAGEINNLTAIAGRTAATNTDLFNRVQTAKKELEAVVGENDAAILNAIDLYVKIEATKNRVADMPVDRATALNLYNGVHRMYVTFVEVTRTQLERLEKIRPILNAAKIDELALCCRKAQGYLDAENFAFANDDVFLSSDDARIVRALLDK